MKTSKRKRYSVEVKAKVALEAIRGEAMISELASRFGIHPTMVAQWKRQAAKGEDRDGGTGPFPFAPIRSSGPVITFSLVFKMLCAWRYHARRS